MNWLFEKPLLAVFVVVLAMLFYGKYQSMRVDATPVAQRQHPSESASVLSESATSGSPASVKAKAEKSKSARRDSQQEPVLAMQEPTKPQPSLAETVRQQNNAWMIAKVAGLPTRRDVIQSELDAAVVEQRETEEFLGRIAEIRAGQLEGQSHGSPDIAISVDDTGLVLANRIGKPLLVRAYFISARKANGEQSLCRTYDINRTKDEFSGNTVRIAASRQVELKPDARDECGTMSTAAVGIHILRTIDHAEWISPNLLPLLEQKSITQREQLETTIRRNTTALESFDRSAQLLLDLVPRIEAEQ